MPNRSVMIIKTLKEEKVNGKLPQFAACLVKSKQISPQKRTLLILAGGEGEVDSRFLA